MSGGVLELFRQYRVAGTLQESERLTVEIVTALRPKLWARVRALSDEGAAEDILQEVWLSLFRSIHRFQGTTEGQVLGFCYAIARNRCADYVRKRSKQPQLPFSVDEMETALQTAEDSNQVSAPVQTDFNNLFQKLLKLHPEELGCLYDHIFLGKSHQEMAAEYGTSKDAIRMRIERAKDKFIKFLNREEGYA